MKKITLLIMALALLTSYSCKRYEMKDLAGVYSDMNDKRMKEVSVNGVGQFRNLDLSSDGTMEDSSIGYFFGSEPKLFYRAHGTWRIVGDSIEITYGPNEVKSDKRSIFDASDETKMKTYRVAIKSLKEDYDFTPER